MPFADRGSCGGEDLLALRPSGSAISIAVHVEPGALALFRVDEAETDMAQCRMVVGSHPIMPERTWG